MIKKIIVRLKGGLGNQLFQYATTRALAINHSAKLIIDNYTGFVNDLEYRRKFSLNKFKIQSYIANPMQRFPFLIYRLIGNSKNFHEKFFGINFFNDNFNVKYLSQIVNKPMMGLNFLDGYWQSYKYFENYKSILHQELSPPQPSKVFLKKIGKEMSETDSIALGIRLFEESKNAITALKNNTTKDALQINKIIELIKLKKTNYKFYVFCSHDSPFLKKLTLPENTVIILPENGFECPIDNLWLLSRCKNHIFTSSTFYWWGAWLSQFNYISYDQIIFAEDNFINCDTIPKNWNTF
jgi:hypothetical protein